MSKPLSLYGGGVDGVGVRHKRNTRQVACEIESVAFAVAAMVEQTVDVVEDIPFADGWVAVVAAELVEGVVGDVLAAVAAVFVVCVEGEALRA